MELRKGYKNTEVGILPDDWEVNNLEHYFSYISYGFTNPMPTTSSGVYMITTNDIKGGEIIFETARKTSSKAYKELITNKSRPVKNDILLTKDGSLGRLAIVGATKICINQSVAIIRPNNRVFPIFLKELLESNYYQSIMLSNAGGSTIKHIYITIVNKMKIGLPASLPEQKAIAQVLSDTDTLIRALQKKINKKRAIKQGAMQQLLKPKKGWERKKLGEIAEILTGMTPPTRDSDNYGNEYCFVSPADLGSNKYIIYTDKGLSQKGFDLSRKFPSDSILFTCIGSTIGKIGISRFELTSNQQINAVLPNKTYSTDFLYYILLSLAPIIKSLASEQAVPMINKSEFSLIEVSLPLIIEQKRIATILSDMDTELDQLEEKLAKYKNIKQGLMQNLLTGKIRLV